MKVYYIYSLDEKLPLHSKGFSTRKLAEAYLADDPTVYLAGDRFYWSESHTIAAEIKILTVNFE